MFITQTNQLSGLKRVERAHVELMAHKETMEYASVIFVGKYEVSNLEYRCFRPEHSSGAHEGMSLDGDNQPVVNVSWNDARAFCGWLTENYGTIQPGKLNFRLPTEKEWEYYATCGSNSEFPWGAWPPPKNLNYFGRENKSTAP